MQVVCEKKSRDLSFIGCIRKKIEKMDFAGYNIGIYFEFDYHFLL